MMSLFMKTRYKIKFIYFLTSASINLWLVMT